MQLKSELCKIKAKCAKGFDSPRLLAGRLGVLGHGKKKEVEKKKQKLCSYRSLSNKSDEVIKQVLLCCSAAEAVESSALTLEGVDNIESGHSFSLGVFRVDN